jgi:hypothetical protein
MNKEYIVVADLALNNLKLKCDKLLAMGATPLGGLCNNHLGLYAQAFLKDVVLTAPKKRGRPRKTIINKDNNGE